MTSTQMQRETQKSPKQQFIDSYHREVQTTLRVLRALPANEVELRPHAKAKTARELAWIFVVEQSMLAAALKGPLPLGQGFPPAPNNYNDIVSQFEQSSTALEKSFENLSDADLNRTVDFFAGPGKMAPYPILELAQFMLCDQIHHRGQLSVYVRMAGGKVPSIYGPSLDEPWT